MARSGVDRNSYRKRLSPFRDWSAPFVVLSVFLIFVFLLGGSARYDVPQLIVLRPLAVAVVGYAVATMDFSDLRSRKALWLMVGAIVALVAAHLVPLPPSIWQSLPGRDIVVEIDNVAGLTGLWRPLSMFPEGTWNALFALSVPLAVLLLASRLDEQELLRLLFVCLLLAALSGLVAVIQASGSSIKFYRITSGTAGLFANRNHQAALLACVLPMLAALALAAPHISRRPRAYSTAAIVFAIALVPLILVTGSRMGLLLGGGAVLYVAAMLLVRKRSGHVSLNTALGAAAVGLALLGAMVSITVYAARDVAIKRIDAGGEDLRATFWQTMIEFLPGYLPWGTGVGSFVPIYQIHEKAGDLMPQYVNQAHNDWLDIALTAGIPGMILLLAAIGLFFVALIRSLSVAGLSGHLRRAGLGVILLLAFASLSDYPIRTPILSSLFAIAAIWATVPINNSSPKESRVPHA